MSTEIYLKTGELSSRTLRKAIDETEEAYKKTEKAVDEALMYLSYTVDGNVCYLFPADATNQLLSASSKLKNALNMLNSLKTILDSGPEALAEIDSRKKNDLTKWWQRTTYSVGVGVAAGTAWIKSLFTSGGGKTGGETVVSSTTDGSGYENQEPCTEEDKAYNAYLEKVRKVNEQVEGEPQYKDWCTGCSRATMICRKQALEGKNPDFTKEREDTQNRGSAWEFKYNALDGTEYQFKYESRVLSQEEMVEMLLKHPEGIMIYKKTNPMHAVVITDFERVGDTIQFYTYDPVNLREHGTGRVKFEETWHCKQGGTLDNYDLFSYIDS